MKSSGTPAANTTDQSRSQVSGLERSLASERARFSATSEILKVIGRSRDNIQPVFDTIIRSATDLCEAQFGMLWRYEDGMAHYCASHGFTEDFLQEYLKNGPAEINETKMTGRVFLTGKPAYLHDAHAPEYGDYKMARRFGFKEMLALPVVSDGAIWGALVLGWPVGKSPQPGDQQLLETFADQASIATENARLFKEVNEAARREAATAEILKIVSSDLSDLDSVFEAVVKKAAEICNASFATLEQVAGTEFRFRAQHGFPPALARELEVAYPMPFSETGHLSLKIVQTGTVAQIEDCQDVSYFDADFARRTGWRRMIGVPILTSGTVWGVILVGWPGTAAPPTADIELIQRFADQAAIAIKNARMVFETQEALEYQTATSEVLSVISQSPNELDPVLDAILKVASRICAPEYAFFAMRDPHDGLYRVATGQNVSPNFDAFLARNPIAPGEGSCIGRTALRGETVYIRNTQEDVSYTWKEAAEIGEYLTTLGVPLVKDGLTVGVIVMAHSKPDAFTTRQIELLETFAAQAVIAINNAQLFDQVQARTAEVTEALEYQTATSEVLGVISRSPNELNPVLETILEVAARLCDPQYGYVALLDPEDGFYHVVNTVGVPGSFVKFLHSNPIRPVHGSSSGRAALLRDTVYIKNTETDDSYEWKEASRRGGYLSSLAVPLVKDGETLGIIALANEEAAAFSEKQIRLLETFAAQAVIAISNTQLFEEVQARTAEVTEALEQQKASAEILSVISQSVEDTQPVFEKILESCQHLFGGEELDVLLIDEKGLLQVAAYLGQYEEDLLKTFPAPWEITPAGEAIRTKRVINYADCANNPDTPPVLQRMARIASYHSVAFAPMIWEGKGIGVVGVARSAEPFTEKELRIMQGFADQAVIAIQNARLFRETKEALESQTATAEVLEVISNSIEDAQPVFEKILDSCQRVIPCRDLSFLTIEPDDLVHVGAVRGPFAERTAGRYTPRPVAETIIRSAVEMGTLIHCPDALNGPNTLPVMQRLAEKDGNYRCLIAPMMWKGHAIGALHIGRPFADDSVKDFSRREMEMLETFADQAVIAIQNARMFKDTQAALSRQTASADILRTISASPTDTKPVFEEIVKSTTQLIDCDMAVALIKERDTLSQVAVATKEGLVEKPAQISVPIDPDHNLPSQAIVSRKVLHTPDWDTANLSYIHSPISLLFPSFPPSVFPLRFPLLSLLFAVRDASE